MFSRGKRCLLLLTALCCLWTGWALGENKAALKELESNWESGGEVVYSGTVTLDQAVPGAVWKAVLDTDDPSIAGEALFTRINETKLRIRKRSATITQDAVSGENTFEISWFLPSEVTDLLDVKVRFVLESPEGKVLAQAGSTVDLASADAGVKMLAGTNQAVTILLIAAGLIWALALLRILLIRRGNKTAGA